MKRVWDGWLADALLTIGILFAAFAINVLIQNVMETKDLVSMIFLFAVFIISIVTRKRFWGPAASVAAVALVNFYFTYPFFEFNFVIVENLVRAIIMLVVALATTSLIAQVNSKRKAEEEARKEKLRANLLRAISHDLRTPLTSIYGASSAILENYRVLTQEQREKLLGDIQEDSLWLINMVENLLSVTKLDGDNVRLVKKSVPLEELIDSVLIKFSRKYPPETVKTDIPDEFVYIPMDPLLIEQVLLNMLQNAVEHATGHTVITLSVMIRGDMAVFEVKDDGCGVPRDVRSRLFADYFEGIGRRSDANKHNMGIGLSVCSSIIKAHDGEIDAYDAIGGGAVFRFSLALEEMNDGTE